MRRPGPGVGIYLYLPSCLGASSWLPGQAGHFSLLGLSVVLFDRPCGVRCSVLGAWCSASCFCQGVLWLGWDDAKGDRQETKQRNNGKGTKQNGDSGVKVDNADEWRFFFFYFIYTPFLCVFVYVCVCVCVAMFVPWPVSLSRLFC